MLATLKHECADTFQPITERGAKSYFDKYEVGTKIGKSLGNTVKGDGYLYRGRGYVQITGRANYQKMTDKLSLTGDEDLILHPDSALHPDIAYRIMSFGMRTGSFTGKKLTDYINAAKCDYTNARRIINALDQAAKIEGYAVNFETILKNAQTA
jgi:putative chitinase